MYPLPIPGGLPRWSHNQRGIRMNEFCPQRDWMLKRGRYYERSSEATKLVERDPGPRGCEVYPKPFHIVVKVGLCLTVTEFFNVLVVRCSRGSIFMSFDGFDGCPLTVRYHKFFTHRELQWIIMTFLRTLNPGNNEPCTSHRQPLEFYKCGNIEPWEQWTPETSVRPPFI